MELIGMDILVCTAAGLPCAAEGFALFPTAAFGIATVLATAFFLAGAEAFGMAVAAGALSLPNKL